MFRTPAGECVALQDRCCHRFAPLSLGDVEADGIRCRYHGMKFSPQGNCIEIPGQDKIPPKMCVRSFPLIERHGLVWIWPGDPQLADPQRIVDVHWNDDPAWPTARGYIHYQPNYQLIADNLLDLSHAEFLHVESFGTNGSLFSHGKQTVEQDDSGAIWNKWDMTGAPPPGWAAPMLGEGATVDQQLHIRWHAPANLALWITMTRSGESEPLIPPMANPHILTPETQTSTHYFFTHEPGPEAEAMARRVFLEEDEPMVAAQAEAMAGEDFWDLKPLILASDKAAILARRKLMQLRRAET